MYLRTPLDEKIRLLLTHYYGDKNYPYVLTFVPRETPVRTTSKPVIRVVPVKFLNSTALRMATEWEHLGIGHAMVKFERGPAQKISYSFPLSPIFYFT